MKNGEPTTSELHYVNKDKTVFKNNTKKIRMPTGEIECIYILDSHQNLLVDGCKGEVSTLLVAPFGPKDFNLAKTGYKSKE